MGSDEDKAMHILTCIIPKKKEHYMIFLMIVCVIGAALAGYLYSSNTVIKECNEFIIKEYIDNPKLAPCMDQGVYIDYYNLTPELDIWKPGLMKGESP